MTETPGSPTAARLAAPGWLDARLLLGVLLVLVSVVAGARVLAAADRTELVWAAARDLAPGAVVAEGDLVPQQVRLPDARVAYLDGAQPAPRDYVVQRGLLAGELVPARALQAPGGAQYRQVTLEVAAGHLPPDLAVGELVDVYVTPSRDGAGAGATRLVLGRLAVAAVPATSSFGGGEGRSVVLNVGPADVLGLVEAVGGGQVDLVRVPVDALVGADPVAQRADG